MSQTDELRAAENAFWHALQERRDEIRAAGLEFDERSHRRFRERWEERRLISSLCNGVARYKKGLGDQHRLAAMAKVINAGFQTWEDVLLERGTPWEKFVTDPARRGAQWAIEDAKDYVRFV